MLMLRTLSFFFVRLVDEISMNQINAQTENVYFSSQEFVALNTKIYITFIHSQLFAWHFFRKGRGKK